jgi:transposase
VHLTDDQWAFTQPFLPPRAWTGRPRADDRRTIEGILYVLITRCRLQDLPREYGAPTTVWRRLKRWGEEGVWERIWRGALAVLDFRGRLDWTMAFLDGSFAPAKNGGDKVGLTKKGKGTKWMLVVGRPWAALGISSRPRQPCGGATGGADVGHNQSRSPAWSSQAAAEEVGGGPRV